MNPFHEELDLPDIFSDSELYKLEIK